LVYQVSCHEKLPEYLASLSAETWVHRESRVYRERRVDGVHVHPAVEIGRGIDRTVVPQAEELVRMDLEMEMRLAAEGITGVAHEAEHVTSSHVSRVEHPRGIAREVRVIELVGCRVSYPEPPAADLVPANAVDRSVRDCDHRRAERGKDVIAVVPFSVNVAAERAVGVAVARDPDDRKDVRALTERRCDLERLRGSVPMLRTMRRRGSECPGRHFGHPLRGRKSVSLSRFPRQ
jgi:hypothetical protein